MVKVTLKYDRFHHEVELQTLPLKGETLAIYLEETDMDFTLYEVLEITHYLDTDDEHDIWVELVKKTEANTSLSHQSESSPPTQQTV